MALSPNHPSLLDPALLAAVDDLQLLARNVVDGFMEGMHVHPIARMGTAFRQYRPYLPGDDPRLLDWKMYARSDRYYIRETETESNIHVRFVIDASASMAHKDPGGISKFQYARMAVAALAYLADMQGDGFVALLLNDEHVRTVPSGRPGLSGFLEELASIEPKGQWPEWPQWSTLIGPLRRRELMVVITDFYEHGKQMREALGHLAGMGREVLAIHLMTRRERELDYPGRVAFEDLESGETVLVSPDRIRDRYKADLQAMREELTADFAAKGIDYREWLTDMPLQEALRAYLVRRMVVA